MTAAATVGAPNRTERRESTRDGWESPVTLMTTPTRRIKAATRITLVGRSVIVVASGGSRLLGVRHEDVGGSSMTMIKIIFVRGKDSLTSHHVTSFERVTYSSRRLCAVPNYIEGDIPQTAQTPPV